MSEAATSTRIIPHTNVSQLRLMHGIAEQLIDNPAALDRVPIGVAMKSLACAIADLHALLKACIADGNPEAVELAKRLLAS